MGFKIKLPGGLKQIEQPVEEPPQPSAEELAEEARAKLRAHVSPEKKKFSPEKPRARNSPVAAPGNESRRLDRSLRV